MTIQCDLDAAKAEDAERILKAGKENLQKQFPATPQLYDELMKRKRCPEDAVAVVGWDGINALHYRCADHVEGDYFVVDADAQPVETQPKVVSIEGNQKLQAAVRELDQFELAHRDTQSKITLDPDDPIHEVAGGDWKRRDIAMREAQAIAGIKLAPLSSYDVAMEEPRRSERYQRIARTIRRRQAANRRMRKKSIGKMKTPSRPPSVKVITKK